MVDNMWIPIAPIATHLKQLYTYFETAPGREKSGPNLREYCPYLSFICHYKTGSDIMQRWIELYFPISSRGEPVFLSPVGNFGLPAMKESSRTNLDPNIVSYTPQCKQLLNFISLLAPLVDPQAASINLLDGLPPLPLS